MTDSALPQDIRADLETLSNIGAIPTILEVVCETTGMGFAAVARVTNERWIAGAVRDLIGFGLKPGGELKLETTICDEIRQHNQPVIIDSVAEDECFRDHQTPKMYGFQSYISVPIRLRGTGEFFGTLCAIDPRPARLNTPQIRNTFSLFADLIAFHLDAHQRLASSEAALLDERQTADLREQFIAVLGHDLRNPLASIASGTHLLTRMGLDERAFSVVALMQNSVARMSALIENVLDFARGRLGGGLGLRREESVQVGPVLQQVVDELRSAWPARLIQLNLAADQPVSCDRTRISQLASNLVSNALTHGAPHSPVLVHASTREGVFELTVANAGQAIQPQLLDRLFRPFVRANAEPTQQGLGLGLYIAAEIAKAHGGTLVAASDERETRFTFRMPLPGPPE